MTTRKARTRFKASNPLEEFGPRARQLVEAACQSVRSGQGYGTDRADFASLVWQLMRQVGEPVGIWKVDVPFDFQGRHAGRWYFVAYERTWAEIEAKAKGAG